MSKTIASVNTSFLYDGVNPVQELNGATPTVNMLTGAIDERFTRTDSTGTLNYLADALGSTLALTDSSGNSQVQYSYDPYGSMNATGSTTNSYTYTGREFDGLGLYYYRARYYNPATARFISEDTIGFGGGINKYAYVGNDPIDYLDPFGMDKAAPNYAPAAVPNYPLPALPKPPDPILTYAQCAAKVQSEAKQDEKIAMIADGIGLGDLVVACAFTGPDIFFCEGIVGGLELLVDIAIEAAYYSAVYEGETQCMQE